MLVILGIVLFFMPMVIFSIAAAIVYKADLPEYKVPCNVFDPADTVPCYYDYSSCYSDFMPQR